MSLRVTFRLLLLVAFLGGLFWLAEKRFLSERPDREADPRVVPFTSDDILSVEIRRGDAVVSCSRKGDEWRIESPVPARADPAAIAKLLSVVESLQRTETVTDRQRRARDLTLKDYGLEPPVAVATFATAAAKWSLCVGIASVVGDCVYVRMADSPDVHATSVALLDALPRNVDALRDRRVFRGEPSRTVRMEVASASLLKLARVGTRWTIEQPVRFRADADAVNRLLGEVYSLRAERFVWDPPSGTNAAAMPARVETYGLSDDEAGMRVKVWISGDDAGQELVIGKPLPEDPTKVFARIRGAGSVCAVSRQSAERCKASLQDVMDRDVFPCSAGDVSCVEITGQDKVLRLTGGARGWMISEPVQWQADTQTVRRLLQNLVNLKITGFPDAPSTDQKALGFAPCFCSVALSNAVVSSADGQGGGAARGSCASERLLISSAPAQDSMVLARFESWGSVFRIPAAVLDWLGPDPVDPLAYRDRQMLAVAPDAVNRVSLVRGAAEQTVVRGPSGAWEAVSPPGRAVNTEAVAGVLGALVSLRALRIEYRGPGNPAAYGFDGTATTLAVGISSGEGIRKTLVLGYRAGTDGRFAMVQGQDVIFVLEKGLAERLTGDLLLPATNERPPSP